MITWYPYKNPPRSHPTWVCDRCGNSADGVLYDTMGLEGRYYLRYCTTCAEVRLLNEVVNG